VYGVGDGPGPLAAVAGRVGSSGLVVGPVLDGAASGASTVVQSGGSAGAVDTATSLAACTGTAGMGACAARGEGVAVLSTSVTPGWIHAQHGRRGTGGPGSVAEGTVSVSEAPSVFETASAVAAAVGTEGAETEVGSAGWAVGGSTGSVWHAGMVSQAVINIMCVDLTRSCMLNRRGA
jgi:hypothetical protein